MKSAKKGDKVIVRDYAGQALIRVLWGVGETCVYLCSEEQYAQLLSGDDSAPAIGFPKFDVFQYNETIKQSADERILDWGMLNRLVHA